MSREVLRLQGISKSFGTVVANEKIELSLNEGQILAILGENGSGKTTMIHMISGIYYPDAGDIFVFGEKRKIRSPKDASDLGIGVVHQHVMLVERMTALENIAFCLDRKAYTSLHELRGRVSEIAEKYGFDIALDKKVNQMSVSEKQTVEILKTLVKGAKILILDEPTAVLTPQETDKLFEVLREMREDRKSIMIITHKLDEVMEISDDVYIMRRGRHIETVRTKDTCKEELANKMVGRKVELSIERPITNRDKTILDVRGLSYVDAQGQCRLQDVYFKLYAGEILGVAGIAGSGQKELCEVLAGMHFPTEGTIVYEGGEEKINIGRMRPDEREKMGIGIGFVPEDRLGMGLIASADLVDNILLREYAQQNKVFLSKKEANLTIRELIEQLEIATAGLGTPIRNLSGGNIQKVLLGRELKRKPQILIVAYPVRGLDINSSYMVYHLLNEAKKKGAGILFIGEDLDVLMSISDRLVVMADHGISGIVDPSASTKEEVGELMMEKRRSAE